MKYLLASSLLLISTTTFGYFTECQVFLQGEYPVVMDEVIDTLGNVDYYTTTINDYDGQTSITINENERKQVIYVEIHGRNHVNISSQALKLSYDYEFKLDSTYYSRTKINRVFCN